MRLIGQHTIPDTDEGDIDFHLFEDQHGVRYLSTVTDHPENHHSDPCRVKPTKLEKPVFDGLLSVGQSIYDPKDGRLLRTNSEDIHCVCGKCQS